MPQAPANTRSHSPPPLPVDTSTYQYEPAWRARNRRAIAAARALRADHARAVSSVATSRAAWHAARRTYVNHVACALRVVEARHAAAAKSKPKETVQPDAGTAETTTRSGRDAWIAAAGPDHRHGSIDDDDDDDDNDDETDPPHVERAQVLDDEAHAPPMLARLSKSLAALGPVSPATRGPGPVVREEVGAQGRAWVNLTDLQSLDLLHLAGLARPAAGAK